jgi:hypothetical protein
MKTFIAQWKQNQAGRSYERLRDDGDGCDDEKKDQGHAEIIVTIVTTVTINRPRKKIRRF